MKLDLDPEGLRVYMGFWRDSLSNAMPMAPEFRLHFIQERPTILRNYERTATAWLMALRTAVPAPADKGAFDALLADIEEFRAWAKAEIQALDALALECAIEAGMDALLARPSSKE